MSGGIPATLVQQPGGHPATPGGGRDEEPRNEEQPFRRSSDRFDRWRSDGGAILNCHVPNHVLNGATGLGLGGHGDPCVE